MSLVKFMKNGNRVQSRAYSNIPNKVFTLKTEWSEEATKSLEGQMQKPVPIIKIMNGLGQRTNIYTKYNDGDHIIILKVSSFTENSFYTRIVKIRLLRL